MRRKPTLIPGLGLAIVLAGLGVPAHAERQFSWFDRTADTDPLGLAGPQSGLRLGPSRPLRFGIDAYKSLKRDPLGFDDTAVSEPEDGVGDTIRLYGEVAPAPRAWSTQRFGSLAEYHAEQGAFDGSQLSGFGVQWAHRMDPYNTGALSAGYGERSLGAGGTSPLVPVTEDLGLLNTRAALSWTSQWSGGLRPELSGSVFLGDEAPRDEVAQHLARRYYGFSVAGQLTLFKSHTPYLAYRLERSYFDLPVDSLYRYEDRARISAGWRWQVMPNWSLQAEAAYGLGGTALDPYGTDRNRFYFGTRFDFR